VNILTVAVHPDDETLGCGGTLLKYASEGAALHWLLITAAHAPAYDEATIACQSAQVDAVNRAYPFQDLHWLKFPTTQLDQLPLNDLVGAIRDVVATVRPEIVFLPHHADVHSDHRITFDAASAVLKSFYMKDLGVRRILSCETLSETDAAFPMAHTGFVPQSFVDITETLERKLEIMKLFASEIHKEPGPRSLAAIRALARMRGASVGVPYAEAFSVLRELQ
jgi:LmbE family N-acetylglucosaminyl deacetylase